MVATLPFGEVGINAADNVYAKAMQALGPDADDAKVEKVAFLLMQLVKDRSTGDNSRTTPLPLSA